MLIDVDDICLYMLHIIIHAFMCSPFSIQLMCETAINLSGSITIQEHNDSYIVRPVLRNLLPYGYKLFAW